jgi:hypothetical protein
LLLLLLWLSLGASAFRFDSPVCAPNHKIRAVAAACARPRHFLSALYRSPPRLASTMSAAAAHPVLKIEGLPAGPMPTPDPFLFCVYHKDAYPKGDDKMQAPRRGNGADFEPSAAYRMYHGDRIPGFPQHPHRGFETITATIEGLIDHTDSAGCAGRYGQGDLQWMTAGRGVVHGEMFPLVNASAPNPTKFFQIWLNLPARSKMVEPAFEMHWASAISTIAMPEDAGTQALNAAGIGFTLMYDLSVCFVLLSLVIS